VNKFSEIIKFIRFDMWRHTTTEFDGFFKRIGFLIIRTIVLVVRGFTSKNLNNIAKSITFSLTFAIVPIMAMIVAVAKGFGVADVIEQYLNTTFLGEAGIVPTIMEMVDRYLSTAQGGLFIGIGILILLWAIYSFFESVETAFNQIWNVKRSRSIARKFSTYITIIVLIPVFIVCNSGLHLFVNSSIGDSLFLQFIISWVLFIWMYMAIPNTPVRFLSAVVPGILMGTLFKLLQMLSVYLIAMLSRTSIVYGAFASIPILMTWLQYTSLLILIGAEMSYAIQNNAEFEYESELNSMSRRYKDFIMLYLLTVIVRRFENSEAPYSAKELAIRDHLPIRLVNLLMSRLVETELVREVTSEQDEERRYQPALDTHKITVGMVIERIDAQGTEAFLQAPSKQMQDFWNTYLQLKQKDKSLDNILVNEL
jgi:membrane protein